MNPNLPHLLINKQVASESIVKLINEGNQLKDSNLLGEEDLKSAKRKHTLWNNRAEESLKRMFSDTSYAEEFTHFAGAVVTLGARLESRIKDFEDDIDEDISRLQSILDRLELIPTIQNTQNAKSVLTNERKIFVVHGHDERSKQYVVNFLQHLDLIPIILHEQANLGKTLIEKFEHYSDVGFAVVLLTPDDKCAFDNGKIEHRARQNVIFELGFFIGEIGRQKVFPLYKTPVTLPSDYDGVVYTPLDETGGWKIKLAQELKAAGIKVDLNRII